MLQMPIANRLAVEKVAAEASECLLQCDGRAFLLPLDRATRLRHLALEDGNVELLQHTGIDAVALMHQGHEIRSAECLSQPMQRDVKAVAQLRRARVGPEGESHLLLRAPIRMNEEIDEQLARPRRTPRGRLDELSVDVD